MTFFALMSLLLTNCMTSTKVAYHKTFMLPSKRISSYYYLVHVTDIVPHVLLSLSKLTQENDSICQCYEYFSSRLLIQLFQIYCLCFVLVKYMFNMLLIIILLSKVTLDNDSVVV